LGLGDHQFHQLHGFRSFDRGCTISGGLNLMDGRLLCAFPELLDDWRFLLRGFAGAV
jgi:hypothetical protein